MSVDGGVTRSTGEILVVTVGDMYTRAGVAVLLCETEVDDEELIAMATNAHEKIVRFYVAVNEVLHMHVLNAANHLIRQHQHRLHGKPPAAEIEEILQRRSKQIHHEAMIFTLDAIEANVRNSDTALQNLIDFVLVKQLRMSCLNHLPL